MWVCFMIIAEGCDFDDVLHIRDFSWALTRVYLKHQPHSVCWLSRTVPLLEEGNHLNGKLEQTKVGRLFSDGRSGSFASAGIALCVYPSAVSCRSHWIKPCEVYDG